MPTLRPSEIEDLLEEEKGNLSSRKIEFEKIKKRNKKKPRETEENMGA